MIIQNICVPTIKNWSESRGSVKKLVISYTQDKKTSHVRVGFVQKIAVSSTKNWFASGGLSHKLGVPTLGKSPGNEIGLWWV